MPRPVYRRSVLRTSVRFRAVDAAPRPLLGVVAEAGANRVVQDVLDGVRQVVVVPCDPGREPVAEEVSAPAVSLVEALGVDAVQAVHAVRELRQRRLHDEVVVRAHEAEDVDAPALAFDDLAEEPEERRAVAVVAIDEVLRDAARRDLKDPARRELVPGDPGHRWRRYRRETPIGLHARLPSHIRHTS
jgi:hypothetical protein